MQTPSTPTTVYHLEMYDPRAFCPKAGPPGFEVAIVAPPKPELNRRFYCDVGSQWEWNDRLPWSEDDWHRYVHRDALRTWVGQLHGQSVGYFELETQDDGNIEIAYFGLLPEFIGRGIGGALLSAAIQRAWDAPDTRRVWAHTCTHDHKHALDNYRKRGFDVFKTECKRMQV
jgi:GNAT superfamily N-acetyltransferase